MATPWRTDQSYLLEACPTARSTRNSRSAVMLIVDAGTTAERPGPFAHRQRGRARGAIVARSGAHGAQPRVGHPSAMKAVVPTT